MLIRISLIIAILAAAGTAALNFVKVKEKIVTLQTNLKTETAAHQEFLAKYTRTKSDLDKTNAVLKATQETLTATIAEKEKAIADATAQKTRADKLNDDLAKTRNERDDAQRELAAYKATGMTPPEVLNANK